MEIKKYYKDWRKTARLIYNNSLDLNTSDELGYLRLSLKDSDGKPEEYCTNIIVKPTDPNPDGGNDIQKVFIEVYDVTLENEDITYFCGVDILEIGRYGIMDEVIFWSSVLSITQNKIAVYKHMSWAKDFSSLHLKFSGYGHVNTSDIVDKDLLGVYITPGFNIDNYVGLATNEFHENYFRSKYFVDYNIKTKKFVMSVITSCGFNSFQTEKGMMLAINNYFPDVVDNVKQYFCNPDDRLNNEIRLPASEKDNLFELFKAYVVISLIKTDINDFDQAVSYYENRTRSARRDYESYFSRNS